MIVAAPYAGQSDNPIGQYLYFFFSGICHQEAGRCFSYQGMPFAVCARCTGIYLGFFLGLIGCILPAGFKRNLLSHPKLLLLFMAPMAIDVFLPNDQWSRLLTGMAASFPVAFFVHQAIEQIEIKSLRRMLS